MHSNGFHLKALTKSYLIEGKAHNVLKELNLFLPSDQITILLGKSGCGKTTLLRILGGLETPSSGHLDYLEAGQAMVPKIGNVFQESRLMPWLNVEDNITFPIKETNQRATLATTYLNLIGLTPFRKAFPSQLSGGMAQRVSIARALAYNPNILLMDEPFSALDYFTRLEMQNELIKIYETTQTGIIFVTHNIDEALALGHRILIMKKNEPLQEYTIPYGFPRDLSETFFIQAKKDLLNLF